MMMISKFDGPHRFLSNFAPIPVTVQGYTFATAEHAYQACKAAGTGDFGMAGRIILASTPGEAKKLGRQCTLPPRWDENARRPVMLTILLAKFSENHQAKKQLLDTAGLTLVEGNHWGDTFWGAVDLNDPVALDKSRDLLTTQVTDLPWWHQDPPGRYTGGRIFAGHNWLGRMLMMVREVLA